MNSHWTALNTTEFSYQIWSCPIFLLKPKRADWLMCFRLLRWIFMSLFWLVCRNLMGSYEFVLWWCDTLFTQYLLSVKIVMSSNDLLKKKLIGSCMKARELLIAKISHNSNLNANLQLCRLGLQLSIKVAQLSLLVLILQCNFHLK